jgi:hypothetical protein
MSLASLWIHICSAILWIFMSMLLMETSGSYVYCYDRLLVIIKWPLVAYIVIFKIEVTLVGIGVSPVV